MKEELSYILKLKQNYEKFILFRTNRTLYKCSRFFIYVSRRKDPTVCRIYLFAGSFVWCTNSSVVFYHEIFVTSSTIHEILMLRIFSHIAFEYGVLSGHRSKLENQQTALRSLYHFSGNSMKNIAWEQSGSCLIDFNRIVPNKIILF